MSEERHGSKYTPGHRPKRGNKARRGKGQNGGSRFDGQHARVARLKLRDIVERFALDDDEEAA